MDLFGFTVRYEARANEAIHKAKETWDNIEDVINALDWALIHDHEVGRLINETGLRGFDFPGARSINEPDIEVFYRVEPPLIVVLELTFSNAKAHYAGHA